MSGVTIRPVMDSDAAALAELSARSADGGRVAFTARHRVSILQSERARHPASAGFVAVDARGSLVGAAWLAYAQCLVGGRRVTKAWLHSLAVDPSFRRQGVARALTQARLQHVDHRGSGWDSLIVVAAAIQAGNAASMANAVNWSDRVVGEIEVCPVPPPRRPPRSLPGTVIRAAEHAELGEVATQIRQFSVQHSLGPCPEADDLAAWLSVQVNGEPLNHYMVATADDGRVVAGLGLENETLLRTLEISRLPLALSAANLVLRVIPSDRRMRNVNVRMPWFQPGEEQAASHLWQHARWEWRERCSSMVTSLDRRGPIASMLAVVNRPGFLGGS